MTEFAALEALSVNEFSGSTFSVSQKQMSPQGHTDADELCDELQRHQQQQPQQVAYAATAPQPDPHLLQQQALPTCVEGDVDVVLLEHHLQPHEGSNQLLPPVCNGMLGRDATSDHGQHIMGFFSQALQGPPQEDAHANFCQHQNALQQQAAENQALGSNSIHVPPRAAHLSESHLLMESHPREHLPYDHHHQNQHDEHHQHTPPRRHSLSDMAWPDDVGMT